MGSIMNSLRLRLSLLVGTSLSAAWAIVACSSDDTVVTAPDAGGIDSGKDATTVDVVDAGGPDADAGQPDSGDGGLTAETFLTEVGQAYCQSVARCCFGDDNLDAGAPVDGGKTYDQEHCISFNAKTGYVASNQGAFAADKARLKVDPQKRVECLQRLKSLTCNTLPAAEHRAARAACYAALSGTQTAGKPCGHSIECATGHFCNKSDAGVGVCEALRTPSAPCGNGHDPALGDIEATEYAEHVCSYRGSGDTTAFCDYYTFNPDGGDGTYKAPADWKCVASRTDGQNCANDAWCSEGICNATTLTCEASDLPFPQELCSFYTK